MYPAVALLRVCSSTFRAASSTAAEGETQQPTSMGRHKTGPSVQWAAEAAPPPGWEGLPEEGTAARSSVPAWRGPPTEEPGGCGPRGHRGSDATERPALAGWPEPGTQDSALVGSPDLVDL